MPAILRLFVPAALCALAACSSVSGHGMPAQVRIAPEGPFTMHPGERIAIAEAGILQYDGLISDSRCPPDVQCVWAGDAEIAFTFTPTGRAPDAFSLHTKPDAGLHVLGAARQLRLISLERGAAPAATLQVDPLH